MGLTLVGVSNRIRYIIDLCRAREWVRAVPVRIRACVFEVLWAPLVDFVEGKMHPRDPLPHTCGSGAGHIHSFVSGSFARYGQYNLEHTRRSLVHFFQYSHALDGADFGRRL